ncbi:MAG TPA: adenylate/guanylate cyclase domain-containing protein [Solirubrobacteraceae bacterium]|nr:adenylate/guanylate cyclase domain-containing protein [Solirubrobacteraceae bacterium]
MGALPDPRSHVPEHLAEKIRAGRTALEGERKQVTVLFADVMGSMDLAEQQDPEAWRQIMGRFFEILCEGVHRFEGTVDKFTGDGIMALFGAPIAHEDHAQRACYAAMHLQAELASYAAQLRREQGLSFSVRIGLNSGEVVVGAIGEDLGMAYTAIGHTVGLAQRMEQLAEPGKAYLTEYTASLAEGYFELADLGEFQVKGASHALRVHQLVGVGAARGRLDVSRARGFSRFVGREDELGVLDAALEQCLAGRPQVIGIVGEAGVGKSRLCDMFARRCRARGLPVYQTSGQAHATSIPLLPVLHIMRSYFDVTDLDSGQTSRERIAGKLLLLDERFGEDLPLVFDFLAVPDPERPAPRMDPEARQRRVLELTKQLVRAQSARAPGVTLWEDLHWFDPASEVFMANHVDAAQGARGLTIVNFRPDYHAQWMSKSYYRQIALAPLGPEAIEQLLADLLGSDRSLGGLADLVRERTGGNPFFIEEVVRSLVEAGNLEGERGAHRLAAPVVEAAVPASVQAVLSARIDRLAESEKAVLQAAAVIGKEFSEPVLARVVALERPALEAALRALVAGEFVFEQELYPEAIYAFTHPLTQEVAYGSQLGERRAAVHAAVARAIVEQQPERLDERAALLARHWESANEPLEAARSHARAGAWVGTKDPTAALRHWRRARELADALPATEETAALGLSARIFALNSGWRLGISDQEAEALFSEAERMAAEAQDVLSLTLLLISYGTILFTTRGRYREALTPIRRAVALVEESGDPSLFMITAGSSYVSYLLGEYAEGLAWCDRAIELADGDATIGAALVPCPLAQTLMQKGGFLTDLGRLDEARELIDRGLRTAAEQGATETVGWGHLWSVGQAYRCGDCERAMVHAQEAIEIAERIGDAFSRTWAWTWFGGAAVMSGQWERAIDAIGQAQAISEERRTAADSATYSLTTLAEAHHGLGDCERATGLARDAVALARGREQPAGEITASVVLARILLAAEGLRARDEIEAALTRAQELVDSTGAHGLEATIHVELAELARQNGDEAERERELGEAHRLFTQTGATAHAGRLAGLLAPSAG